MDNTKRVETYKAQTNKDDLTPRQERRVDKALRKLLGSEAACGHKRVRAGTACENKDCTNYAFGL